MQSLEALTRDARALANGDVVLSAPETEVARQMQICNACGSCEGFCAVFPAMTRRLNSARPTSISWPTCATTAVPACTPASTHRRTNLPSTCRRRWRRCAADLCRLCRHPRWAQLYQRNGLTLSHWRWPRAGAVPDDGRGAARRALAGAVWSAPQGSSTAVPAAPLVGLFRAGVPGSRRWRWPWASRASGATDAGHQRRAGLPARPPPRQPTPCCA